MTSNFNCGSILIIVIVEGAAELIVDQAAVVKKKVLQAFEIGVHVRKTVMV